MLQNKKVWNSQCDNHSISIDNFNEHYIIVFDFTSMQDITKSCHYPEKFDEPLSLELNFNFDLELVTELILLRKGTSFVAVENFGVLGKYTENEWRRPPAVNQPCPFHLIKIWRFGSFLSDYAPNLLNETFAIINTQHSNSQGEHWNVIANFYYNLYFEKSLRGEEFSLLKQYYKQMMAEPLRSYARVCCFHTINSAFHLFQFRPRELTGVHDIILLSFISIYMWYFILLKVNMWVIHNFSTSYTLYSIFWNINTFECKIAWNLKPVAIQSSLLLKGSATTVSAGVVTKLWHHTLSDGIIICLHHNKYLGGAHQLPTKFVERSSKKFLKKSHSTEKNFAHSLSFYIAKPYRR